MQFKQILSYSVAALVVWSVVPLHAAPSIFHCSETANPGDVITLQGDSFGTTPQVWMEHVIGTETSLTPQKQLKIVGSSTTNAAALIPDNETTGVYAIFVSNDNGVHFSPPAIINRARAFGANDLCGTAIDAGRSFRLFGRNLYLGSGTPGVTLVPTSGPTIVATVSSTATNDNNVLQVSIPTTTPPVSNMVYTVEVSNGFGGTSTNGVTAMPYTLTGRASSTNDPFSLGVPWSSDFTNTQFSVTASGADPTGVTNSAPAIKTAIGLAAAHGGEVIFPPGTYLVNYDTTARDCISLSSKVVIMGTNTPPPTIMMSGIPATNNLYGIIGANIHNAGIYNLNIQETNAACNIWQGVHFGGCSNVFIKNSSISMPAGISLYCGNNSQIAIENSAITNTWTHSGSYNTGQAVEVNGNTDVWFKGNPISYYFCRLTFDYNERALVENNYAYRNAYSSTTNQNSGGLEMSLSENSVVLNNSINKGTDGESGPIPQDGDGETILVQGGGGTHQDYGTVTLATNDTLTDLTKMWTNNYSTSDSATYNGQLYYVAIVSGTGAGQVQRMSSTTPNTPTMLYVGTNWAVPPDSTSHYSIFHSEGNHQLIKNNHLSNNVQGIEYYSSSLQDVTVAGNTLQDNGGILMSSDYRLPNATNGGQFSVNMDNQVIGNTIVNTTNDPYISNNSYARLYIQSDSVATNSPGTSVFDTEVRNNSVTAPSPTSANGEGYAAQNTVHGDNTTQNLLGVLFQGNMAANTTNAFHLSTGAYNTTIWNNDYANVANIVADSRSSGTTHASINTSYGAMTGLWTLDGSLVDSSGNAQIGTNYGTPTFTNDVAFTTPPNLDSMALNGTSHVEVPHASLINSNNEMTIAFWVKGLADGIKAYQRIISKDTDVSGVPGWEVQQCGVTQNIAIRIDTSATSNQIEGTITGVLDNNWHFIAYVLDHGTVHAYIDNRAILPAQTYTEGTGFGNDSANLSIGSVPGGAHAFTGQVDEVQIYQMALTPTEVGSLYY